jgi:hypothetical protein
MVTLFEIARLAQLVRAIRLHRIGRRFKSYSEHHFLTRLCEYKQAFKHSASGNAGVFFASVSGAPEQSQHNSDSCN